MKYAKSLSIIFAVLFTAMLCGCSHDKPAVDDLIKTYASNNADVVMVNDLDAWCKATNTKVNNDGSITLDPTFAKVADMLTSSINPLSTKISEFKGIDYTNCISVFDYSNNFNLLIVRLKDEGDFGNSLKECGFSATNTNSYKIWTKNGQSILVKDRLAFAGGNDGEICDASKTESIINQFANDAKANPIADWKLNYLNGEGLIKSILKPEVVNMFFGIKNTGPTENDLLKSMYVGLNFDVEDLTASVKYKCFDNDGKSVDLPYVTQFDTSLLKYASPKDIGVLGYGLDMTPELREKIFNVLCSNRILSTSDSELYNKIIDFFGGQIMIGGSMPLLVAEQISPAHQSRYMACITLAKGKDAELRSIAKQNASMLGIKKANSDYSKFEIDLTSLISSQLDEYPLDNRLMVYVMIDNNQLVVSTSPISYEGGFKDTKPFENAVFAGVLNIDKSTLAFVNAPFGFNVVMHGTKTDGYIDVTLTDTTGNFFINLAKSITLDK